MSCRTGELSRTMDKPGCSRTAAPAALDLIDDVYQGPLEPEPWSRFGQRLRKVLSARIVAITLHHGQGTRFDTYVMAKDPGDRTDWEKVEADYRERFMRDDPRRLDLMRPGEIVTFDHRAAEPSTGRFLASLGIGSCLRTSFAEPGGMRCWIDVARRHRPYVPFSEDEVGLVRTLLPHLSRALGFYADHKRSEIERTVYEDVLEHFALGSVLLDGELKVVHANRAAETLIAAHPRITLAAGRLRVADAATRVALDAALARALAANTGCGARHSGELVRVETPGGTPLALLVSPIALARYYQGSHAPSVVVHLSDVARKLEALHPGRSSSQELVGRLFGLTPQEARLALLLADGCTLATAAAQIGVAETAVRSYSKRIYAKLGINSQSDIVRLVYRSFALLR